MMRCGENNHHVHDGYGKEMAPSSDVNYTDEDTDEDRSNNSIVHEPFHKPSSYFNSVITLVGTSDESFCDKVSFTMLHSDSLTSIDRFSDEGL